MGLWSGRRKRKQAKADTEEEKAKQERELERAQARLQDLKLLVEIVEAGQYGRLANGNGND